MFFAVSKILWMVASPIVLLPMAACAALLARPSRASRLVALGAVLLMALLAVTPVGSLMIAPLENRFPPPPADMPPPDGIIALGGALRGDLSEARGQAVFEEGERVVQAAILARRYPNARVIFSGGTGSLLGGPATEAEAARELMVELGVAPSRIVIEAASRNTDENARFAAALLHPRPTQHFLLVTSAFHMPRSMRLFEEAGFDVTAFPVAFRTPGPGRGVLWGSNPLRNFETVGVATKEWIGLIAYWATGRIDTPFPGPADARPARPSEGGRGTSDYSTDGAPRR